MAVATVAGGVAAGGPGGGFDTSVSVGVVVEGGGGWFTARARFITTGGGFTAALPPRAGLLAISTIFAVARGGARNALAAFTLSTCPARRFRRRFRRRAADCARPIKGGRTVG